MGYTYVLTADIKPGVSDAPHTGYRMHAQFERDWQVLF